MCGYGLEYWVSAVNYPVNIGGKPFHSWPNFIPVWFETTVLGASLTAVIGMLGLNGLPEPYHPVFNIENFVDHGQKDKFYLVVESTDPKFKADDVKRFMGGLTGATNVWEVPN